MQYMDDTLILADPSIVNLWTIIVILKDFELASGLRVNFFKISLIGVNVDHAFLFPLVTSFTTKLRPSFQIPWVFSGSCP